MERYTVKDVNKMIELCNVMSCITENGLKLRYYSSSGSYRVALVLNQETFSEKDFKHELKHKGCYYSLMNFRHLVWLFEKHTKLTKDDVIEILDNCGFTYSR